MRLEERCLPHLWHPAASISSRCRAGRLSESESIGHPATYSVLNVFATSRGTSMKATKKTVSMRSLSSGLRNNARYHRPSCESKCLRTHATTANCLLCHKRIIFTGHRDTLDHIGDPVPRHCSWPTSKIRRGSCHSSSLQPS